MNEKLEGTLLADFKPRGKKNKTAEIEVADTLIGSGEPVQSGATIIAHYTGALCADGTIFQSSHDTGAPATFGLDQVIKGWSQGVPGMKVGGKRRLVIPSALAYGSVRAASNIPPNSDLVFDIELIAIEG